MINRYFFEIDNLIFLISGSAATQIAIVGYCNLILFFGSKHIIIVIVVIIVIVIIIPSWVAQPTASAIIIASSKLAKLCKKPPCADKFRGKTIFCHSYVNLLEGSYHIR